MQARMNHPAMTVPDAMPALQAVGASVGNSTIPPRTIELVNLRASQINGCGVCLVGHAQGARRAGETDDRLVAVAGWRDAPFYSDAERAALALDGGGHPSERPVRPGARRGLGRGRPPLRRDGPRGARARDRQHQPLEPPERRDAPAGGCPRVVRRAGGSSPPRGEEERSHGVRCPRVSRMLRDHPVQVQPEVGWPVAGSSVRGRKFSGKPKKPRKSNRPSSEPALAVEAARDPRNAPVVLDEADDRRLVGERVVDVVELRPRRDDEQREPRPVAAPALLTRELGRRRAALTGAGEGVGHRLGRVGHAAERVVVPTVGVVVADDHGGARASPACASSALIS